jgi:hypothetical protein
LAFLRELKQQPCHKLIADIPSIWCDGDSAITAKNYQAYEILSCGVWRITAEAVDNIEQGWQVLAILSTTVEVNRIGLRQAGHYSRKP